MKKQSVYLLLTWVMLIPSVAFGSVFYVRPGGGGNGTSWTSAYSQLPGSLERGSTYYLAAGNYGSYNFDDGGTATIVIKKATVADHGPAAGWLAGYGNGPAIFSEVSFDSNYIFDGGGQYGFLLRSSADQSSLVTVNGSNVTIRNTEMTAANADIRVGGVYAVNGPRNLVLDHVYIHDIFGVGLHLIDGRNISVANSKIARNRSTNGSQRFPGNDPRNNWHTEGIQARSTIGLIVKNSLFKDVEGTAAITCGSGVCGNWDIYNNVFDGSRGLYPEEGGMSALVSDNPNDEPGSISDVQFHHNVVANMGNTGNPGVKFAKNPSGNFAYNNIWYNSDWIGMQGVTHGYNSFYDAETNFEYRDGAGNRVKDVVAAGSPFVGPADFRLKAHTAKGKALSAPYNIDAVGQIRSNWDRGAYEFGGSARPEACVNLDHNLAFGAGETGVDSADVRRLQEFLISKEHLSVPASGFFGKLTLAAVKRFQATFLPVADVTGLVGELTRAEMACD